MRVSLRRYTKRNDMKRLWSIYLLAIRYGLGGYLAG